MDVPDIYEALGSGRIVLPISACGNMASVLGDPDRPLRITKRDIGYLLIDCAGGEEFFYDNYSSIAEC